MYDSGFFYLKLFMSFMLLACVGALIICSYSIYDYYQSEYATLQGKSESIKEDVTEQDSGAVVSKKAAVNNNKVEVTVKDNKVNSNNIITINIDSKSIMHYIPTLLLIIIAALYIRSKVCPKKPRIDISQLIEMHDKK